MAFRWTWTCHLTHFDTFLLLVESPGHLTHTFSFSCVPKQSKHGSRASEERNTLDSQFFRSSTQLCRHVNTWPTDQEGHTDLTRLNKEPPHHPLSFIHVRPVRSTPSPSLDRFQVVHLKDRKDFLFFSYPHICPPSASRSAWKSQRSSNQRTSTKSR